MTVKCIYCTRGYSSKDGMLVHLKNDHVEEDVAYYQVQCTECKEVFAQKSNMKAHLYNKHLDFYKEHRSAIASGDLRKRDYPGAVRVLAYTSKAKKVIVLTQKQCEEYESCGINRCKHIPMNDEARIRHELRHELRKLQDQAETDQAQPSLQSSVVAEQETPTNPSLKNVALKTHKTFMIKCNVEDCGAEYDSVEKFEEHTNEHVEDVSGILTFEKNSSRETKRTNSESLNAKKQKISE